MWSEAEKCLQFSSSIDYFTKYVENFSFTKFSKFSKKIPIYEGDTANPQYNTHLKSARCSEVRVVERDVQTLQTLPRPR